MYRSNVNFNDHHHFLPSNRVTSASVKAARDQSSKREATGDLISEPEGLKEEQLSGPVTMLGRWRGEIIHPGFGSFPLLIVFETNDPSMADGRYAIGNLSSPLYGGILPQTGELQYVSFASIPLAQLRLAPVGFFNGIAHTQVHIVELEGYLSREIERLSGKVFIKTLSSTEAIPYGAFRLARC